MAIDTRNRRASAIGFLRPWSPLWPNPDGSLASVADRQQMAYCYAASGTVVAVRIMAPSAQQRTFAPSATDRALIPSAP